MNTSENSYIFEISVRGRMAGIKQLDHAVELHLDQSGVDLLQTDLNAFYRRFLNPAMMTMHSRAIKKSRTTTKS